MGKFILNLFWDKIRDLPIAQNILITNKKHLLKKFKLFALELYYAIIIPYLLLN